MRRSFIVLGAFVCAACSETDGDVFRLLGDATIDGNGDAVATDAGVAMLRAVHLANLNGTASVDVTVCVGVEGDPNGKSTFVLHLNQASDYIAFAPGAYDVHVTLGACGATLPVATLSGLGLAAGDRRTLALIGDEAANDAGVLRPVELRSYGDDKATDASAPILRVFNASTAVDLLTFGSGMGTSYVAATPPINFAQVSSGTSSDSNGFFPMTTAQPFTFVVIASGAMMSAEWDLDASVPLVPGEPTSVFVRGTPNATSFPQWTALFCADLHASSCILQTQ